jgi:PhnB protein
MVVEPYLNFDGRCAEAIEFYKKALGAEVLMAMKFDQAPPGACGGADMKSVADKIMHATLKIGDSIVMCTDGQVKGTESFHGTSLSLKVANDAQADRAFAALGEGGKVCMPMAKTFFSSKFGMVTDKFGVPWMVIVNPEVK